MRAWRFLTALLLATVASASYGDRQPAFKSCVTACEQTDCAPTAPPLPLHLRMLFWTCESNCDYKCQRQLTVAAQKQNAPVYQYHGKWPFVRIWGVQEPASVIFSVLNGYMHLKSWPLVRNGISKQHPMRLWLSVFVVLGTWTWLWSAVFHIRDFSITEKLDYYSAGLNVLYMFFLGVVRLLRLKTWRETRVVVGLCAVPYFMHVGYLSFIKFDYQYNMLANAIVGLMSNVAWFVVTYQAYHHRNKQWWKPAVLILLTDAAFSLEAFDFPPFLDSFDAHSLWHGATILLVPEWYDFLVKDARWDSHIDQLNKD